MKQYEKSERRFLDAVLSAAGDALLAYGSEIHLPSLSHRKRKGMWLEVRVPVGRGLSAPIRTLALFSDLWEDEAAAAGSALGSAIAAVHADRGMIACTVASLAAQAETVAKSMRSEGIEIMLTRTAVAPINLARGSYDGPRVKLTFIHRGGDLKVARTSVRVDGRSALGRELSRWRPELSSIAAQHARCVKQGARATIDVVAAAGARHFGVEGRDIDPHLPHSRDEDTMDNEVLQELVTPTRIHFLWDGGRILARFPLGPRITWDMDRVELWDRFIPEVAALAAAGRPIETLLDHLALRGLLVDKIDQHADGATIFVQMPGLQLLHTDGRITPSAAAT